jgi:hypothetical protein
MTLAPADVPGTFPLCLLINLTNQVLAAATEKIRMGKFFVKTFQIPPNLPFDNKHVNQKNYKSVI